MNEGYIILHLVTIPKEGKRRVMTVQGYTETQVMQSGKKVNPFFSST